MRVATRVLGIDDLDRRLADLRQVVQRRLLARALRVALRQEIQPAVIAKIPWRIIPPKTRRKSKVSGLQIGPLKRAFSTRVLRPAANGTVRGQVVSKTGRVDGFYARFLEKGWNAGPRKSRKARRRIAGRPFVQPAAEARFAAAAARMTRELGTLIDAELAKGGSR